MTSPPKSSSESPPDAWRQALAVAKKARQPPKLIDARFKEQTAYLEDGSGLVAVLCTRRAGKSYGAALRLLRAAYSHPGASCLYVALTRDSTKRILWKDVLKALNREKGLGATFNETSLAMTLPNGSVVYLLGADTDEEEKQKLLGQKYAAVVIDESASFSIDLNELVYGILKPAVADYRGSISLIGTPGNLKKGLYFDLTQGQDPLTPGRWEAKGWSCHRWSAADNPHMAKQWKEEIDELKASNPLIEETPLFQQHYLGRWVIDESKLVYRYQVGRNDARELPRLLGNDEWTYVLGVDLGYEPDPSAFVVCAYSKFDRALYLVEASKQLKLDVTGVAERIKSIQARYDIARVVIDNSAKQAVEEMKKRHGLMLHPADKVGKEDFIELMNGDFIQGYIKLLPEAAAEPQDWVRRASIDEKSDKRKEHANCDNHCTDAALYAWRHAYSYLADRRLVTPPAPNTTAWHERHAARIQAEETQMKDAAMEEALQRKQERDEWEEFAWAGSRGRAEPTPQPPSVQLVMEPSAGPAERRAGRKCNIAIEASHTACRSTWSFACLRLADEMSTRQGSALGKKLAYGAIRNWTKYTEKKIRHSVITVTLILMFKWTEWYTLSHNVSMLFHTDINTHLIVFKKYEHCRNLVN